MKQPGDYTLGALLPQNGIPFFAGLVTSIQPLVNAYNAAYNVWLVSKGSQKSKTQQVKELLEQLAAS